MPNLDLWTYYAVTVAILWAFLLAVSLYRASPPRLRRLGMSEEYIRFLRRDITKRSLGIAIAVPLLLLASAATVWIVTGELRHPRSLAAVAMLFIVLVIPFPILDVIQLNTKYRELALSTGSDTVVDLGYRILHLVFSPTWEGAAAVLYLAYFVAFVGPFHVAFIHLLLLWCLYGAARSGKYLTRPMLKEGYGYVLVFLVLNQGLLLYHLLNVSTRTAACDACGGAAAGAAGLSLSALLAVKLGVYLSRYPRFSRALSRER